VGDTKLWLKHHIRELCTNAKFLGRPIIVHQGLKTCYYFSPSCDDYWIMLTKAP